MNNVKLVTATEQDLPFLEVVYASTRQNELKATGWGQTQIDEFLAMQFAAQHKHYHQHYPEASFDLIYHNNRAVGRLYVDRSLADIRIVDIALLPEFRGMGIGGWLLQNILEESRLAKRPVAIHVEKNNRAMAMYQRLGFIKKRDVGIYDFLEYTHRECEMICH
ncbi:GNAT family N-acetyltransferase [Gilvimarinus xylanilyticus]|uniref:GNAT family N-acetyltransferase n=1 Tax=Gilvimarinus xylanilyticus TaxID=2944139 RepID=A0A9X2I6Z7_9GAMM|nr:GNAT family N-acetyltransferase [Gilvimarinus xylanilyticus]MCP8900002.1 GNAT family N-acetyltransferase [Gilvimarinus xylanilyticus]